MCDQETNKRLDEIKQNSSGTYVLVLGGQYAKDDLQERVHDPAANL